MKRRTVVFFLVLLINSVLLAQFLGENDIISVKKDSEVIQAVMDMNLDVLFQKDDLIFIVAGAQDLIKLNDAGIVYSIESANFIKLNERDAYSQGGINGAYHSYLELEQDLYQLETLYPHLAKVEIIGTSHESRHIYAVKISDNVYQDEN
ncbi:MAG TPA: M14 family zinc carboxypeptidase, partial [Acidobacteriota bacterium]|nr:M14 family zinc carboxypeptidase [Acidobacteriota bacterium]